MAFPDELHYQEAEEAMEEWFDDDNAFPEFKSRKEVKLTGNQINCGFQVTDESAIFVKRAAFEEFLKREFGPEKASQSNIASFFEELSANEYLRKSSKGTFTRDVRIGKKGEKIKLMEFNW